jgi:hypothetical protein
MSSLKEIHQAVVEALLFNISQSNPFPWHFIILCFPLKPVVFFGHCGKVQRSSSCILGALTLTRPIRATSVTCPGLTLFVLMGDPLFNVS